MIHAVHVVRTALPCCLPNGCSRGILFGSVIKHLVLISSAPVPALRGCCSCDSVLTVAAESCGLCVEEVMNCGEYGDEVMRCFLIMMC